MIEIDERATTATKLIKFVFHESKISNTYKINSKNDEIENRDDQSTRVHPLIKI